MHHFCSCDAGNPVRFRFQKNRRPTDGTADGNDNMPPRQFGSNQAPPVQPSKFRTCPHRSTCPLDTVLPTTDDLPAMIYLIKTLLVLFLVGWTFFGLWMVVKFNMLFGPHRDDPAETPGARSFGVAHVASVWFGFFVLALYFLLR